MIEKMNKSPPSEELRETLMGFGTWDTIHLNGGRTVHGDILNYPYEKRSCEIKNSGIRKKLSGINSWLSNECLMPSK